MRAVSILGLGIVAACSATAPVSDHARPQVAAADAPVATPLLPPDTVDPGGAGPKYPGTGFRVHEWGTNTVVIGSDGTMLRGLQHEEEDLPSFVYHRRREELAQDGPAVKMETPVTYFYSDEPLKADVTVSFPKGVLTQWYPTVSAFNPPFYKARGDLALAPNPSMSDACREQFSYARGGSLKWGWVDILPRAAKATLPDAPLARYTWSHARDVDANSVRVAGDGRGTHEEERFLFYRGLGNFPLNVSIAAQPGAAGHDGGLVLTNQDVAQTVGAVFVLRVEQDRAAFSVTPGGIAPRGSLIKTAPVANRPLDVYSQELAKSMVDELDKAGLYHDESVAMVKTWARQWFRTPGVRVLYLAPQAWTDTQIPLYIEPKPVELVRVMVIRVEALTPAVEADDLAALEKIGPGDARAQGEAHFRALGRFAEPRLRRAIAQTQATRDALTLLNTISRADVSAQIGE